MKGKITEYNGYYSDGWITGYDGNTYFLHATNCEFNSVRKNLLVEFDVVDEGKEHLKAVNIKKIGLGDNHPFCHDCKRLIEFIQENTESSEEQEYRIRDLLTMYNYFSRQEELLPDKFRSIYRPEKVED